MMVSRPTQRWLPVFLCLLLFAVACSSTSQKAGRPDENGSGPGGTGPAVPSGSLSAVPSGSAVPGSLATSGGGRSVGKNDPRVSTKPVPGLPGGPILQGITDKTIRIGFWYLVNGPACAALGVRPNSGGGECSSGDSNEYQALVNWVNTHGGIGGRKIEKYFYATDLTQSSYAIQAQNACTYLAEDKKVAFVISEGQIGRPYMARCLKDHKIPFIEPGWYQYDNAELKNYAGYMYQPSRPRPERWTRALVDGLAAQGYFVPGEKVGVVRFDAPPYERVMKSVIAPRLKHHKVDFVDAPVRYPDSFSGYSDMNAQLGTIILSFVRQSVKRVFFFDGIGELETFFVPQAESQHFRPIYGFSSMSWPNWQADLSPVEQLRNAVGVGWSPFFDVPVGQDPGGNASTRACKQALEAGGVGGGAGRNNKCDGIFLIKTLFDRAQRFSVAGLRSAAERLGAEWLPSGSFSTVFGPGRYDGPASYTAFFFNWDSKHFQYRKPLKMHHMA
jgi:hypothetical protein